MGSAATPLGISPGTIPPFTASDVLPPFLASATNAAAMSPYLTDVESLVDPSQPA
jgi:hypothetical protein